MPRQARFDYESAFHHIMSRGFKREKIFDDEKDYKYYLDCLDYFKNYGYKVFEYCLMPNHTHIAMQTFKVRLQDILRSINTRYALYRSRRRRLPGPIFQGRPKSILIENTEQLKIVGRYILRNPKRAGLCKRLAGYKWSSYGLIGANDTPDWHDNSLILNEFSEEREEAINLYKKYIEKPQKVDERDYPLDVFGGIVAGSKEFYEKIIKKFGKDRRRKITHNIPRKIDYERIIKEISIEEGIRFEDLLWRHDKKAIEIKQKIAYILKEMCHKKTAEIKKYLKISQPTLSRYVIEVKKHAREDQHEEYSLLNVIQKENMNNE